MNIREKISKLSESDLRKKIIIPMLKSLDTYDTEDFHGSSEKGKDVYFSYKNIFGRNKHCCFFIKKGDIYRRGGKNDIRKMQGAIEEAIQREFISPIDNKTSVHIEEFYFVCSGKINKEAREWLSELLIKKRHVPNFDIFDIDNLIQLILDLIKKFNGLMGEKYEFNIRTFNSYCKKITNYNQKKYITPVSSYYGHSEGKIIKINYG